MRNRRTSGHGFPDMETGAREAEIVPKWGLDRGITPRAELIRAVTALLGWILSVDLPGERARLACSGWRPKMTAWTGLLALAFALSWAGCGRPAENRVQGYVEGEFVYVASPRAGRLDTLAVRRGMQVAAGDLLFALESAAETAARDQAVMQWEEGQARLADARKGLRSSEIAALDAQLDQARAALVLSEKEFLRQTDLTAAGASTFEDLDKARAARDQERHRVSRAEADIATARLGARSDQVAAEEAHVRALAAALARAEWDLTQKRQSAPVTGLVFDTLYRQGEWVPAGRPVISLLAPTAIKVRAFVPETRLGSIHVGDAVRVSVDGVSQPLSGKISFISPQAEYTPPVIYSQESRSKLVFMIEAVFDPTVAATLHPGQPVDVTF